VRETVAIPTPARFATSLIVGISFLVPVYTTHSLESPPVVAGLGTL
jgi:hypothetical protein